MPIFAHVRRSRVALLLLFCCSSLPLLTKKNTALCLAMCQKTSLKGSHEKRKYQFHIKAKDESQKAKTKAISLQIGVKATKQQSNTWKIKG